MKYCITQEPKDFAINCASESCPKLANRAYDGEHLEEQLKQATIDFLSDASKNNFTPGGVSVENFCGSSAIWPY